MDREKFANLPMKSNGAHNIELAIEYCDPRYDIRMSPVSPATDTGLIALFRLEARDSALPGFAARWDDRAESIDVDPDPAGCINETIWRSEKNGYQGHHTQRLTDPERRTYQIEIRTPEGQIFKALGRLNLAISARIQF